MISIRAQKTLWGRAAGRCSFPDCRVEVFFEEEASNPTLIGENCHIVAERDGGPRGDQNFIDAERNSYSNLILLCRNHHKVIDDPENGERNYSVEKLRDIKLAHEAWVREQLGFDLQKQRDDEAYADIIDEWEIRAHVDEWAGWSQWIFQLCPSMRTGLSDDLDRLSRWILCRVWPQRYPQLDDAFENFRRVLEAFQNTFHEHADLRRDEYWTPKLYRIPEWNPERYEALFQQHQNHIRLLADLMLELTRATNLICDLVRENILYGYRREQGRVLTPHNWVAEYSTDERKANNLQQSWRFE